MVGQSGEAALPGAAGLPAAALPNSPGWTPAFPSLQEWPLLHRFPEGPRAPAPQFGGLFPPAQATAVLQPAAESRVREAPPALRVSWNKPNLAAAVTRRPAGKSLPKVSQTSRLLQKSRADLAPHFVSSQSSMSRAASSPLPHGWGRLSSPPAEASWTGKAFSAVIRPCRCMAVLGAGWEMGHKHRGPGVGLGHHGPAAPPTPCLLGPGTRWVQQGCPPSRG